MRKIRWLIVHHTATPTWTTVESIRNYHVVDRGWSDIGYHYLIDMNGCIRLGRPEWRIGAHCKGKNKMSIGIAVIGHFMHYDISEVHIRALSSLIGDLQHRYPDAEVKKHSDFARTLCPGMFLERWLSVRYGI